jgi:hypothetical protein
METYQAIVNQSIYMFQWEIFCTGEMFERNIFHCFCHSENGISLDRSNENAKICGTLLLRRRIRSGNTDSISSVSSGQVGKQGYVPLKFKGINALHCLLWDKVTKLGFNQIPLPSGSITSGVE